MNELKELMPHPKLFEFIVFFFYYDVEAT